VLSRDDGIGHRANLWLPAFEETDSCFIVGDGNGLALATSISRMSRDVQKRGMIQFSAKKGGNHEAAGIHHAHW
jgi:hypothetical protein